MKFVKWLQTTFVASCVAFGAVSSVQASKLEDDPDYTKALYASAQGHHKTAVKHLNKAIKKGNPAAEFFLGMLYGSGVVGKGKEGKATELIVSSCRKGYQDACLQIDKIMAIQCSKGQQGACNLPKFAK